MVKKWQTLIEAHIDVKTTDGYLLRFFCIGFTQKQAQQTAKCCYAQSQQVRVVNLAT
jgi:small subunit ribosomal protein S3Ae